MKKKNKAASALGVILAIILIIVAAVTLFVTVLFAKKDTPELFGYYLYTQNSTAMEVEDPADDSASIHSDTIVFAKKYNGTDPLSVNNAVLCVLAPDDSSPIEDKDSDGYAIRRILKIEPNEETGELLYYPTTMQSDRAGTEPPITGSSILGLCEFEHSGLYSYITFTRSLPGIILLLGIPCVLLIIMLIAKITRSKNRRLDEDAYAFEESYDEVPGEDVYDEDYTDEEYDDEDYAEEDMSEDESYEEESSYIPESPVASMFTSDMSNTSTLDRKRVSIAQNFTPKAVNPNSPYQKARTMQFKAQKDVPILNNAPYDQPVAPVQPVAPIPEPAAKFADFQSNAESAAYHGSHEADSSSGGRVFRRTDSISSLNRQPQQEAAAAPAQERSTETGSGRMFTAGSRISSSSRSTSSSSSSSVDDILAMIEKQKKNL